MPGILGGGRRVVGGELAGSLHLRITRIRSRNWEGDTWDQLLILFTFLQPQKDACAAMVTKGRGKTLLRGLVKARLMHVSVVSSARKTRREARQTRGREEHLSVASIM